MSVLRVPMFVVMMNDTDQDADGDGDDRDVDDDMVTRS